MRSPVLPAAAAAAAEARGQDERDDLSEATCYEAEAISYERSSDAHGLVPIFNALAIRFLLPFGAPRGRLRWQHKRWVVATRRHEA